MNVDAKVRKLVTDALVGVVADPRGTGHRARLGNDLNIAVGGKTGTAQVVSLEKSKGHAHLQDHAWFVGFAPAEDPQIVVAALVENGGGGGAAAAPVVRAVMDAFFRRGAPGPATVTTDPTPTEGENAD
jgi:penicillin-binding protein 2